MSANQLLLPGNYYHIFNRAIGEELLYRDNSDYQCFLNRWKKFTQNFTEVYAYCLMPNHFHFLIHIKDNAFNKAVPDGKDDVVCKHISKQFSNLFNSYARSYNFKYARKGKVFMLPFKRKTVKRIRDFKKVVLYIHKNPAHHGYTLDPLQWEFMSYREILNDKSEWIKTNSVLQWFGGTSNYKEAHWWI
ncbi:MAG: hypothetical protein GY751_15985 [Bacteroidetes bacterium]|nr:hypothetical protein [Bacteroidota bacterium]